MDKDAEDSISDETVDGNSVNEDSENLTDFEIALLIEKQQRICKEMKKIEQEREENKEMIQYLQNCITRDIMSLKDETADGKCHDSPMASPIHKPTNLSDDSFEMLDYPPIEARNSKQTEVIYDPGETPPETSAEEFNDASPQKTSIYAEIPDSERVLPSRKSQNTSDNETQSARTDSKFKTQQKSPNSEESYDGKGKKAANPKYRYKKRPKSETSAIEIPSQKTPVKLSTEECGASEENPFKSQSPEADVTKISPAVKRKELTSDDGFGANDTDDLKVAKKLKLDDEEKARKQYTTTERLILQKDYKRFDSSQYIDQSQTDQDQNKSEQLIHPSEQSPSSSGLSKVCYASSSKESSHLSENQCRKRKSPSLTSGSDDVTCRERKLPSLTSGSDDVTCRERKLSSLTSGSDDMSCREREESSHSSASFRVPYSETELSLASASDDGMFRERESYLASPEFPPSELSLTRVGAELPLSEIRDSYLTTVSDFSWLIASTSYEQSETSQTDQIHNESEQLNLPYACDRSKVSSSASSGKDTSRFSGNDVTPGVIEQSSLASGINDGTCSDRKELPRTSGIDDGTLNDGKELPLTSRIDDGTLSEKEDPSVASGSNCGTCSERENSSHESGSDDFTFNDREESSVTLTESFLTTATDLSELIESTSDDVLPSTSEDT